MDAEPQANPGTRKSTLVLGLGNDILSDDGVGLHLIRELQKRLDPDGDIEAVETCEMGLSLLDLIVGYRRLVLIDSVKTGRAAPGHIHEVALGDVEILPLIAPHFFGIGEVVALGRQLGLPMPDKVAIYAIEVVDPFTVSTAMSAPLQAVFPSLVETIRSRILKPG